MPYPSHDLADTGEEPVETVSRPGSPGQIRAARFPATTAVGQDGMPWKGGSRRGRRRRRGPFSMPISEAARGSRLCPADRADAERVVRFFMLEKALYEVAYELANRPDWIVIPLRGVLALLDSEAAPLVKRTHRMPFGAELQADGRVRFRLWAPPPGGSDRAGRRDCRDATDRRGLVRAPHRSRPRRYAISLRPAGWPRVPDPASRYQPDDVHGPSEVVDPAAYDWGDAVARPSDGRRQ